jgi:hypothetical protein
MQRVNKWDGNYTPTERSRDRSAPVGLAAIGSSKSNAGGFGRSAPAFGGNRSTTRSVSRGANNDNNDYGVWGKKTTQEYY